MIITRKSSDRGHSKIGWLDSFHTFSFSDYYDSKFMGLSNLRVINEDRVQPGCGFGSHRHKNMEIISYVVDGLLEHRDSLGTGSVIKPGEIQKMSAGSGIEHSEFNHSKTDPLHFLQIWIIPERQVIKPSYEQKRIHNESNKLLLIGSHEGQGNAVLIHQDASLFVAYLTSNHSVQYLFEKKRQGWLQLIKGKISLNGCLLSAGDGAEIKEEDHIVVQCIDNAELLLFDLA